jgi:hypothetical protein
MSEYKHYVGTAWVSEDGSFNYSNHLITFDPDKLTEEQWDRLAELSDYDRIEYAMSIMDGNDLTEWEGSDE